MKHVIVFLTIFWFLPRDDYAQAKESGKSKFIKVTNLEGLRVKCILKDLYGFMWFGTASDAAGTRKAIYAMQKFTMGPYGAVQTMATYTGLLIKNPFCGYPVLFSQIIKVHHASY